MRYINLRFSYLLTYLLVLITVCLYVGGYDGLVAEIRTFCGKG